MESIDQSKNKKPAFIRIPTSVPAYVHVRGALDHSPVTLYIPRSGSVPVNQYQTISDALKDDGFFLQYDIPIMQKGIEEEWLDPFLERCLEFAEDYIRFVVAVVSDPIAVVNRQRDSFDVVISRDKNWVQLDGENILGSHLAGMESNPVGGSQIAPSLTSDSTLRLGEFEYSYESRNGSVSLDRALTEFHLNTGRFTAGISVSKRFFEISTITQPLLVPDTITRRGKIRAKSIAPSIFDFNSVEAGNTPAQLDFQLIDHGLGKMERALRGIDLANKSGRQNFESIRQKILSENAIRLTGVLKISTTLRDTVNRPVQVLVDGTQSIRFLPFISRFNSEVATPSTVNAVSLKTYLVPEGKFPIIPVDNTPKQRRLKCGPSNVDVFEYEEDGSGFEKLALVFLSRDRPNKAFRLTDGFVHRALGKFSSEITKNHPVITDWVSTVWPELYELGDNQEPIAKYSTIANEGSEIQYYAQPDAMVLYGGGESIFGLGQNGGDVRQYRKDNLGALTETPLPIVFFGGLEGVLPDIGKDVVLRSDLLSYLAQHRADFLLNPSLIKSKVLLAANVATMKPGVTPQTFIIDKSAIDGGNNGWKITLAETQRQSEGGLVKLELWMFVYFQPLMNLFSRNEFLLVFPDTNAWDYATTPPRNRDAVNFGLEFQIGEWAFNLAFDQSVNNIKAQADSNTPVPCIVVLKFEKGKLRDQIRSADKWTNRDLLSDASKNNTSNAAKRWVTTLEERSKTHPNAYKNINSILDDEEWAGVLLISPAVDLGNLPDSLKGIAGGLKLDLFRANHFGFTLNRLTKTSPPKIESSSLFGLIDYYDDEPIGDGVDLFLADTGTNSSALVSVEPAKFDYKVESLLASFENSEIVDFRAMLLVRFPDFMDEPIQKVDRGVAGNSKSNQEQEDPRVFRLEGGSESKRDENGSKISSYNFIYKGNIGLSPDSDTIFNKILLTRVEVRTEKTTLKKDEPGKGNQKEVETSIIVDAEVDLDSGSSAKAMDILGFDSLTIDSLKIPFVTTIYQSTTDGSWRQDKNDLPTKLTFDMVRLNADPNKRRKDSFLKNFPVKFKSFIALDNEKTLDELGFMALSGADLKYGLEFDVDFGSLAKMIGFDTDLKGALVVGWVPAEGTGKLKISMGLGFPDQGGKVLDLDLGFLRIQSSYFDTFELLATKESPKQFVLVANDIRIKVFNKDLPNDGTNVGLVLAPAAGNEALNRPMGWMTSIKTKKLFFIEDFFLAIGQRFTYKGSNSDLPRNIVTNVKDLASFSLEDLEETDWYGASKKYRDNFRSAFKYNTESEWFVALSGKVANAGEAYALYNPPTMFGGELELKDLFTISLLYKQISPEVGLYTGSLLLSEKLRSIDVGAVRLQIPKISAQMDTDGGYGVNIGLNLSRPDDFTNSAGAEVTIFKGNAGVYYAKLHGSAFSRMPKAIVKGADNRHVYSPVTQIMLAGRFGLGREFNKGILRAGASITIYGVLSGMWGKKNEEYKGNLTRAHWETLPSQYSIYWGEVGILAEIYGVLDFSITRFRLEARLLIGVGTVFETWQGTIAYIRGSISFSVRWVIASFKVFGKRITISVRLKFQAEFRQEWQLAETDSRYNTYFEKGQAGLLSTPPYLQINDALFLFDKNIKPVKPDTKRSLKLFSTIDISLNDDGQAVLVPLIVIPGTNEEDNPDVGTFSDLVSFIFEWSIDALPVFKGRLNDDVEFPIEYLSMIDDAIVNFTSETNSRGAWSSINAWDYLLCHFDIELNSISENETPWSATAFVIPGDMDAVIKPKKGKDVPIKLGDKSVDSNYAQSISEFFKNLRIPFDKIDSDSIPVTNKTTSRFVNDILFEEYLDAILRSMWGRFATFDWGKSTFTVNDLAGYLFIGNSADSPVGVHAISHMVTQQRFGGIRVPDINSGETIKYKSAGQTRLATTETKSIWEFSKSIINYQDFLDAGKDIESLSLNYNSLQNMKVSFDVEEDLEDLVPIYDEANRRIKSEIDHDIGIQERYPRHTLVEDLELLEGTKVENRILVLPLSIYGAIETGLEERKPSSPDGWPGIEVTLLKSLEAGKEEGTVERPPISFEPTLSLHLPVKPVPEAPGAFELAPFPESEAQLLNDFVKYTLPIKNSSVEVSILQEVRYTDDGPSKGELLGYKRIDISTSNSYLGRVNFSTDPNPTSGIGPGFESLADVDGVPILSQLNEVKNVLRILEFASVVNSGGYLFGFQDNNGAPSAIEQDTSTLIVCFTVSGGAINRIPAGINTLTIQSAGSDANDALVLKEIKLLKNTSKSPGTLSINVNRRDPSHQFTAIRKSTNGQWLSYGSAVLSAEEAVQSAIIADSSLMGLKSMDLLPNELLTAMGKDSVEILRRFNLLQVAVKGNNYFDSYDDLKDLPTPPEQVDEDTRDDFLYRWTFPIFRLAKGDSLATDLYPDKSKQPVPFIYAGIGKEVDIEVSYRDILGFAPKFGISKKQIKLAYTDALIPVGGLTYVEYGHYISGKSLQLSFLFKAESLNRRKDPQGNIIESESEWKDRLVTVSGTFKMAVQQCRDANVTIKVECSLGFDSNDDTSYEFEKNGLRDNYLDFLNECLVQIDAALAGTHSKCEVMIPIVLSGKPLKSPIVEYHVNLCFSRPEKLVAEELKTKGTDSAKDIYSIKSSMEYGKLIDAIPSNSGRAEELSISLEAISSNYVLAHGKTPSDAEMFYIVDSSVFDISSARAKNNDGSFKQPIYSSSIPLATRPYANKNAQVRLFANSAFGNRKQTLIQDFDQDEALIQLCRDLDKLTNGSVAANVWASSPSENIREVFHNFLKNKDLLASTLAGRSATILKDDEDDFNDTVRGATAKNKKNTLRKRLRAYTEVDSTIASPVKYKKLAGAGDILLHGAVVQKKDSSGNEIKVTNNPNKLTTDSFGKVSFNRNDDEGVLVVNFDAKFEARVEIASLNAEAEITHLRWVPPYEDTAKKPSRWLALIRPMRFPLSTPDTLNIPVLYRKLIKKPTIEHKVEKRELGKIENWEDIARIIKQWKYGTQIQREGAAIQDDLYLDIEYNRDPNENSDSQKLSGNRPTGVVLFEYIRNRNLVLTNTVSLITQLRSFAGWSVELANSLTSKITTNNLSKLDLTTHELMLRESSNTPNELVTKLYKRSEQMWNHCVLNFYVSDPSNTSIPENVPCDSTKPEQEALLALTKLKMPSTKGDGSYFSKRLIAVDKLNVFEYESARPVVRVVRNHSLGDRESDLFYGEINNLFRYETEKMMTGEPLTPFTELFNPILLPVGNFKTALGNFLNILFEEVDQEEAKPSVTTDADRLHPEIGIRWGFDGGELLDVQKIDKSFKMYGPDPIAEMAPHIPSKKRVAELSQIESEIDKWEDINGGRPNYGAYVFDVTVFARLGAGDQRVPRPLLRIHNLRVPV